MNDDTATSDNDSNCYIPLVMVLNDYSLFIAICNEIRSIPISYSMILNSISLCLRFSYTDKAEEMT
jgi:hypothetical protein